MENHINLTPPSNHYLLRFYEALTNFEQLNREERERRRVLRNKKIKQKQYD